MSANTKLPPPPPPPPAPAVNGVITGPPAGSKVGQNRKKQKRRAKQAAKVASQVPVPSQHPEGQAADVGYDEDALRYDDDEEDDYSDAEHDHYDDHYTHHVHPNGVHPPLPTTGKKKNKKKTPAAGPHHHHHHHHHGAYDHHMLPPIPPQPPHQPGALRPQMRGGHSHGNIWNTSTQQERQNIKEFWLSLSEDERKSLLKIEKEAVLKKMKQQQKHSCSCSVCGRKRTAIEEELEVLYEGYYEELEQYAHHDTPPLPSEGVAPEPLHQRPRHPLATSPPPPPMPHHKTSNLREHLDEDESSDEEEEYSDDEEEYSDEDPVPLRGPEPVPDFLNFGSHLTVKDNLLTVADDLLKNDGRKFIEMMEQLAERRMQRESRSVYEAEHHAGYSHNDPAYDHEDPLGGADDYDDDEASFDSQDEYDDDMDEEDDMVGDIEMASSPLLEPANYVQGGLTEQQRMQEGRRMFQIFAARMFEQRVLTAYREKVAAERQRKLLEELDHEETSKAQREAKKARDAQKKKEKKKQQQAAKAEEKAKKDAEKAEEEARLREAEEKKQEEQRRKKEEQRKKREEDKKRLEEERARKEADRLRRQQEEQQRREESERKAREQKAAEKARKEEARKKEREEREAREKEARDRKAQEEKEKRDREAKSRAEKESKDREKGSQQAAQPPVHPPQITKRPSQVGMVAVPGVPSKQTHSGISSPHPQIATPTLPKAPTPAKQRQASHQGSHASSPKQTHSQLPSAPSKPSSPTSTAQQQAPIQPKTIMQKTNHPQHGQQAPHPVPAASPLNHQPIQPPPGMPHPPQHPGGFAGIPPMGYPGFQGPPHGAMPGMGMGPRGQMPMFPHQGPPPMGMPNRMSFGAPGMNGMPLPPGMMPPPGRGFPFDPPMPSQPPPGFSQMPPQMPPQQPNQTSPIGHPPTSSNEPLRHNAPGHARQQSSGERERFDPTANQPIARPAPIQRPSSVKPAGSDDLDDLSKHLGSSALLDDTDEPLPLNPGDARRHSNLAGPRGIAISAPGMGPIGGFGSPVGGFGTGSSWNTPAMPFGQSPGGLGQPGWGTLPTPGINNWANNNAAFAPNGAFGGIGAGPIHRGPGGSVNRPLIIRQAACQACKQLDDADLGEMDGYHKVDILVRQMASQRIMLDSAPPSLREIEEICETEGDNQNGGGELHIRKSEVDGTFSVKWTPGASTPDQARGHTGLGEIGSPMPSKSSPATGFGPPGMGRAIPNLGSIGPPVG